MLKRLLVLLLLIPLFGLAQSSGKVAGYVTDSNTGEPLVGANILIEGTLMGAQSDADGFYFILNVPVGALDLRAVYVGYQDVLVQGVRVSGNTTTNQNFELTETAIELGEAVVVTAERPLVEKNVTQSYSLVTAESIESIPVRGLNALLNLQASVVVQDGNVYIRGGRAEEVGYYLDGASITNPLSNTNSIYVIQDAVEEIQVLTGGFSSEFGGANSGIVRSELKTGGEEFHFSLDGQTDRFASQGEKFLGTRSYNDHIIIGTISGPITDNIKFFTAIENNYTGDTQKRFGKAFEFTDLVDANPRNSDVSAGNPDTVSVLRYGGGYTPGNETDRWAVNSTLLFDLNPFQIRLSGVYNFSEVYTENEPILNLLNDRDQHTEIQNVLLTGKFSHVLSPTTFYDLKFSYFDRKTDEFDDYFGNDWRSWQDSAKIAQKTGGDVIYRSAFREMYDYTLNGIPFARNGALPSVTYGNYYNKTAQQYYAISGDLISQVNNVNEIKVGFDFRQYTLRQFNIRPEVMETILPGQSETDVDPVRWKEFISTQTGLYGYDIYGNELDDGFDGAKKPVFAAAYIQDKIEYNDVIINAGVRFDYFDAKDRKLKTPDNPAVDLETGNIVESEWKDINPFIEVSPRLGFSFPVSEKTVFYTQYGKFLQMPELNDMYYGQTQYSNQIVVGGNYFTNPVGYGFEPISTISYEVGFRQQLGENAAFDITGFYKNVKGEPKSSRVIADPRSEISTYNVVTNGDFATTKGFEVKLVLRRVENLSAQVNYTYTQAEGTGSGETAYLSAVDNNAAAPSIISPLDFSQTHRGTVNLDYRFGPEEGGTIFNRFGANVLFTFNSGHPFTLVYFPPGGQVDAYSASVDYMLDTRSRQALEPINSSTTPWNFNVDLRLDKSFGITEDLDGMVYVRVTNLFNIKNHINVYQTTGSATDDGHLTRPEYSQAFIDANGGQKYIDLYKAVNLDNGQGFLDYTGTELFSQPRQIMLGLRLNY